MDTKFNVSNLIKQGLVKKKEYTEGPYKGLSVLKYSRKVFYNNLWNTDSRLLDCRGTVIDKGGNIVVYPFTKIFNYQENGTLVNRDKLVVAPRKMNGFLGVASNYNGQLLVSTTGTLDSEYAMLAREVILNTCENFIPREGLTYMFEICHESDPHIIEEECGAYLIGMRKNYIGSELFTEEDLDYHAKYYGFKRPLCVVGRFSDILELSKHVDHEGFMTRDFETQETLCKLKSNYYLSKKAIMRLGEVKVEDMYNNPEKFKQRIDEEFYSVVDFIVSTIDTQEWKNYNDQQRREIIETYFKEKY